MKTRKPNKTSDWLCTKTGCNTVTTLGRRPTKPETHLCRIHRESIARKKFYDTHRDRLLSKNPAKNLKQYGLTISDFDTMVSRQGGVCAICRRSQTIEGQRLCVDHDHDTGKVRGLLCHSCNMSLGLFKDKLVNAARYLMQHTGDRTWDKYFLDLSILVSGRSKDRSTQVGSVLVQSNTVISTGYNGFPRGIDDDLEARHLRPEKYIWTCHAEENAILNAARVGAKTEGATLYVVPMAPCTRCARAIIQSQISRVVFGFQWVREEWEEDFENSFLMMAEAGLTVDRVLI